MISRLSRKYRISILTLLVIAVGFGVAVFLLHTPKKPSPTTPAASTSSSSSTTINANTIYKLINDQRASNGLKPLTTSPILNKSAAAKCQDMLAHNYYDHISPTDVSWKQFMSNAGYPVSSSYVGENLAEPYSETNANIVSDWMNSSEHKANILDVHYIETGVAVCTTSSSLVVYVVQHFGGH